MAVDSFFGSFEEDSTFISHTVIFIMMTTFILWHTIQLITVIHSIFSPQWQNLKYVQERCLDVKSLEIETHSVFTAISLVVMVSPILMMWTWHDVTDSRLLIMVTFPAELQVDWFTDCGVISRWWHGPEMSQTEQKVLDGFFPESESLMVRDVLFFPKIDSLGRLFITRLEVFLCDCNRSSLKVQRLLSCGDKKIQ